jgi:hypothetical protein
LSGQRSHNWGGPPWAFYEAGGTCQPGGQAGEQDHADGYEPNDDNPAPPPALCPLGLGLGILQKAEAAHSLVQILSEGGVFLLVQLGGLLEQTDTVLHLPDLSSDREPDGPSSHHLLAIPPQPIAQARCLFPHPEALGLDSLAIR